MTDHDLQQIEDESEVYRDVFYEQIAADAWEWANEGGEELCL